MAAEKLTRLLKIASQTKTALLEEWRKEGCFKDKNTLTDKGVYAEGVGLCSTLLMLVAFRNEESVFSEKDKAEAGELISSSLSRVYEWSSSGFGASPILEERVADLFNDKFGYMDTVSWCLSASILARYAERIGVYSPDAATKQKRDELMAKALAALISSQRPDGTWGFATDVKSKKSLYYTYVAACSLADFFDYILGEIEQVEAANEDDISTASADTEMLLKLNATLGNTEQMVRDARAKLQHFLVYDCLPMLPRVANCDSLSESDCERLGLDIQEPVKIDEGEGRYYHHLYYAYYMLDIMITSASDVLFNSIANVENDKNDLHGYYGANSLMSKNEQKYYATSDNFVTLFTSYYEQALHASRVQYMNAKRTGRLFWDTSKSELPIRWRHEDEAIEDNAVQAIDQSVSKEYITDPSLLPMSLRANIMYSYYVTDQPDIVVDRLFDDICDNVSTDAGSSKCVEHLWDNLYYSLPVTERSIEALIDYYDYLMKFEAESAPIASKEVVCERVEIRSEKSEIEAAIEKKIEKYLLSEACQKLIASSLASVAPTPAPAASAGTLSTEALIDKMLEISEFVEATYELKESGTEHEKLVAALIELSKSVDACKLKLALAKGTPKTADEDITKYEHRLNDHATRLQKRGQELVYAMDADINDNSCEFTKLYETLKHS